MIKLCLIISCDKCSKKAFNHFDHHVGGIALGEIEIGMKPQDI